MVQSPATPTGPGSLTRLIHRLLAWGAPVGPLRLVRTGSQTTGTVRSTPVAPCRWAGDQWLVAPFGATGWVRNARVDGTVVLGRGRRYESFAVIEIDGPDKAAVLRHFRKTYRAVPFVRGAFTARPVDGLEAFAAEADRHPVFRLRRTGPPGATAGGSE